MEALENLRNNPAIALPKGTVLAVEQDYYVLIQADDHIEIVKYIDRLTAERDALRKALEGCAKYFSILANDNMMAEDGLEVAENALRVSENERLKLSNDASADHARLADANRDHIAASLKACMAERDALKKALEPFASLIDAYDAAHEKRVRQFEDHGASSPKPLPDGHRVSVSMGELRAARAALRVSDADGKGG